MRKIVDSVLVILIIPVLAFTYLYHDEISKKLRYAIYGLPCSKPITYSIGVVDPRFDLSSIEVENLVVEAASKWNEISGKNLLEKSSQSGKVVIDFVYDSRQQATETLSNIKSDLNLSENELQELKSKYDLLRAQYLKDKSEYDSMQVAFEQNQRTYTEMVRSSNRRGGAKKVELEQLNLERVKLEEQYDVLQSKLESLNSLTKELNQLAGTINSSVKDHNSTVATYNNVVGSQPREFEEGEFIQDSNGMKINIYQFDSEKTLSRVLQHELGHALGLDHVDDDDSIMYPYNTGDALSPTNTDILELERVCKG